PGILLFARPPARRAHSVPAGNASGEPGRSDGGDARRFPLADRQKAAHSKTLRRSGALSADRDGILNDRAGLAKCAAIADRTSAGLTVDSAVPLRGALGGAVGAQR